MSLSMKTLNLLLSAEDSCCPALNYGDVAVLIKCLSVPHPARWADARRVQAPGSAPKRQPRPGAAANRRLV